MLKLKIGPAILVTAAFIGPGTVITASLAGANYGYALLWALLFSIIATIILQEMAARLGLVTQQGLGENLHQLISQPLIKWLMLGLVVCAIVIGNGAYQSGNLMGASLGMQSLLPDLFQQTSGDSFNIWPSIIGLIAFLLMWGGHYKTIEKSLVILVVVMSLAFLFTFLLSKPDIYALFSGLLIPTIPTGASLTVIALIGTTVVPYNLFLHASSVKQKWQSAEQLPQARRDIFISIPIGGLISIAITATAASAFFGQQLELHSAADLAPSLQPLLGNWAPIFMALGLFAAGISSAITAPLAAAFALAGVLKFSANLTNRSFKFAWISILLIGVVTASLGFKPVNVIWFAQIANGILLPVICAFLLWAMNASILGQYRNSILQNCSGAFIFIVTLALGARSLMSAFGML